MMFFGKRQLFLLASFLRVYRYAALLLITLTVLNCLSSAAHGTIFTLLDDNSDAVINTNGSGMVDWDVDGVDQLEQQWFWFRSGATAESPVSVLPILVEGTADTNFDGDMDTLYVKYDGGSFEIELGFKLDGGLPGSGTSDIAEQISINNLSGDPLDISFFQYADFDLDGVPAGDTVIFTNPNTVRQSKGPLRLTETVNTPVSSHREADLFPATLTKLSDGLPTTLSETPPIGTSLGPGNVTWAFQWDVTVAPNSTFQISKVKNLNAIPEPAGACLLLTGLLFSAALRTRRKRK